MGERDTTNETKIALENLDFIIPGDVLMKAIEALGYLPFHQVVPLLETLRTLSVIEKSQIITPSGVTH